MAGPAIAVDTSQLARAEKALASAETALADEGNTRLLAAARVAATELLGELRASAAASPTPQARIVADAMSIAGGREVAITIGGAKSVGSRGTAAGALVTGSEMGGRNFDAPSGGAYWIAPAVDRYSQGGAARAYSDAINAIIHDAGLS